MKKQLFQTFGPHGKRSDIQRIQDGVKLIQELVVHGMLQISDGNVGFALRAHGMHGKHKLPGAHPAADEIGIEQKRLHKAVPGPSGDPFQIRFRHTSGGIGAHIYEDSLGKSVYEQHGRTAEHIADNLVPGIGQGGLGIADLAVHILFNIVYLTV